MSRMTKAQLQERLEVQIVRNEELRLQAGIKELEHTHLMDDLQSAWREKVKSIEAQPAGIEAVLDERGERYGEFRSHALMTQGLKAIMNGKVLEFMAQLRGDDRHLFEVHFHDAWYDLSFAHKEALEMIAHKIGRILNGDPNYDDSWLGIAGYAELGKQEAVRAKAEEKR